jgi:uncharacterized protein (DUF433 family)
MTTQARTTRTEHPHIVMTPGTCGGRPRIDGTRITVELIAGFINDGADPTELIEMYPHLTLGGVYDAIIYYYDHKEQLDREIEENTLEKVVERGELVRGADGRLRLPPARSGE